MIPKSHTSLLDMFQIQWDPKTCTNQTKAQMSISLPAKVSVFVFHNKSRFVFATHHYLLFRHSFFFNFFYFLCYSKNMHHAFVYREHEGTILFFCRRAKLQDLYLLLKSWWAVLRLAIMIVNFGQVSFTTYHDQ